MAKVKTANEEVEAILIGDELDRNTEVGKQTPAIQAAIKAGDVVAKVADVNRKFEDKKYRKQYLQLIPTTLQGVMALALGVESTWTVDPKTGEGDFDGACLVKDYFYGYDLGVKAKQAQAIAIKIEGPDKAKTQAAKQLAKAFGITEAEAMAKIEAMGSNL